MKSPVIVLALCLLTSLGLSRDRGIGTTPGQESAPPRPAPQARECGCDPAKPETMEARACGLCREAEKQPPGGLLFFLKDNNPRKPNRWLALPRAHAPGMHDVADLKPKQRAEFWRATVEKAREIWGDDWGLAVNGDGVRTQCHGHIHVGRLLQGVETPTFLVVSGPAQVPLPKDDGGLWVLTARDGGEAGLAEVGVRFAPLGD